MKIIIFIIILTIIFIILCNIDKNINDNFKNYEMSNMGNNKENIKIHGNNINIKTNKTSLNVNKLCIKDKCLNMKTETILPRKQGDPGVCNDNDCYKCTCNRGQPADIGNNDNSCKKKRSDNDKEQCKSCMLGYKLDNAKKCVACSSGTYNDNPNNTTMSCKNCETCSPGSSYRVNCGGNSAGYCQQCAACQPGQHRVDCGGNSAGRCVNNVCNCNGGTAATGSDCTSNGEWKCTSCNWGYYKNGNTCMECQGCPTGQHRVNCGGNSAGMCVSNICNCNGGQRAEGAACPINGEWKCTSCNWGYYKNGNTCTQCRQCNNNEQQTRDCSGTQNRVCIWKQCNCNGGTAASGANCPWNGAYKCIGCHHNHTLRNDVCTYNRIQVFQKSNYRGQSKVIIAPTGSKVNLKHTRYDNGGKKIYDTISSFKKDPNLSVVFYRHDLGGRGECINLGGIGDTNNVGWWNDLPDSIGFGTECYRHHNM